MDFRSYNLLTISGLDRWAYIGGKAFILTESEHDSEQQL